MEKDVNLNFENLNLYDCLKKIEERNQFIDILIKEQEQEEYSTDSLEYQSFKLAVAAIAFSIVLHNEYSNTQLTESHRRRMAEIERLMEQEYKDNFPYEKATEDDISLKDIPKMLTCLKELLEKHEKSTEIFAALQCSLKDIETAMSQEKQFLMFLKNV